MYYHINTEPIEEYLMETGLNKLEFAALAKINHTTLYRIFKSDEYTVNGKTLQALSKTIGCKPVELVRK